MYHFRLKCKRYKVCTNCWDSNIFGVGLPLFPLGLLLFAKMGSLNYCFQNPSESSGSSQGTPAHNSCDKAYSTMMKSKGLSTDPWWTPTFPSNSWLKPSPKQMQPCTVVYISWTNHTIHSSTPSFLRAHQITFCGTQSYAFSRSTKTI